MADKLTAEERARRSALTSACTAFFLARPYQRIPLADLERLFGKGGWRTRVSESRRYVIVPAGGSLENELDYVKIDGKPVPLSYYVYKPQAALGPAAHEYREVSLFAPSAGAPWSAR